MMDYLNYSLTRRADGIYHLEHRRWGKQLWCEIKLRKICDCMICKKHLGPGDKVYRPITNAGNRYERICKECIEQSESEVE